MNRGPGFTNRGRFTPEANVRGRRLACTPQRMQPRKCQSGSDLPRQKKILRPVLGVFLDVRGRGFRALRKIDKIRENVQGFVTLGIDRRLFRVIGSADCVCVVIGSSFRRNFCRAFLCFRLREFTRIHDQLEIRLVDVIKRDPINIRFLFVTGEALFRAGFLS